MKVLKLIAIVPLVLLSANSFAQARQQGSRNDRDSYRSRNSSDDRDPGRRGDSRYDRDQYRGSGRYVGSRYSYRYVAPYVSYPRSRPSGLTIGLYDDYGYATYGYRDYGYGYYPPVVYRSYRPAPILRVSLNIGGRGGRGRRR